MPDTDTGRRVRTQKKFKRKPFDSFASLSHLKEAANLASRTRMIESGASAVGRKADKIGVRLTIFTRIQLLKGKPHQTSIDSRALRAVMDPHKLVPGG